MLDAAEASEATARTGISKAAKEELEDRWKGAGKRQIKIRIRNDQTEGRPERSLMILLKRAWKKLKGFRTSSFDKRDRS